MSVPPELMALMAGGGGQSGPANEPSQEPEGDTGPSASPMSTPQPNHGERQTAYVNISLAGDLLERALPAIGSETPEGRALIEVLNKLSKSFGHTENKAKELVPAELMQLMQSLPQAGGGSEVQKAMGAPGGMPHGAPGAGMQPKMPGMA